MTRIESIRAKTIPLKANYSNATVSFAGMTGSIVAIVAVREDGKRESGYGFGSIGRYAHTEMIQERFAPRILDADPSEYNEGGLLEPVRLNQLMRRNEKQGGHGERSVAIGAVDMAAWDLYAKLQGKPLYQCVADRFNGGNCDSSVRVYAAGGYYYEKDDLTRLERELEGYLEAGFVSVKIKIGGATLETDLKRIETAISAVGSPDGVAVDANCRFKEAEALEWGNALEEFNLRWYEEPVDPLDYEAFKNLGAAYGPPLATGENLFSVEDVRNLVRYGGLRPDKDIFQMDPGLSYGISEYNDMINVLEAAGWTRRSCFPHGGNLFNLHIAQGLQIGGTEVYPGVFDPLGGFGSLVTIHDGVASAPELSGIGWESKPALMDWFRKLSDTFPNVR